MKLLLTTATVLLLACIVPAPAQATELCTGNVCVSDTEGGPCDEGWGSLSSTNVNANAAGNGANVGGWSYCDPWFQAHGISGFVTVNGEGVSFFWWAYGDEFSHGCGMGYSVWNSGEETDIGCPAGAPPNPGWGALLP